MPHDGTLGDEAARAALVSLAQKARAILTEAHDICALKGWTIAAMTIKGVYAWLPANAAAVASITSQQGRGAA